MFKKMISILMALVVSAVAVSGIAFADEGGPTKTDTPPGERQHRHRGRGAGEVIAIGEDHFSVRGLRRGREAVIYVDEHTEFTDQDGNPMSFSDLQVGQRVAGSGERRDGQWYAVHVRILPPRTHYKGAGTVNEVGSDEFTFTGQHGHHWEFYVDGNTQYTDRQGNTHSFDEIQPDMRLFVKAEERDDGKWWATVVGFPLRQASQVPAAP